MPMPTKNVARLELREYIRRFTPAWHALVMGTGAVTILLSTFPFPSTSSPGLQITALTILIFNLILFILLTSLTIARYVLFPELIRPSLLVHPTQSLYLGCLSMGFAIILMGAVLVPFDYFGLTADHSAAFLKALWVLWWVDVGISITICFGQLYLMFSRQTHSLSTMTLMWLLPIVTLVVVSGAGVLIAQALTALPSSSSSSDMRERIYLTLAVCTPLVSIGLALSLSIIVIYLLRLMVYKLPEGAGLFSVFLPLGPLGQAGFTYIAIGEIARKVFPLPSSSSTISSRASAEVAVSNLAPNVFASPQSGEVLYFLGWFAGFVLWAFATCWLVLGFLTFGDVLLVSRLNRVMARRRQRVKKEKSMMDVNNMRMGMGNVDADVDNGNLKPSSQSRTQLPFKVTFWGMIFPNGVYANLTIHLAHTMSSQVLRVWGTVCAVFTITLWVYALVRTVVSLRDGSVFEELCVPLASATVSPSSASSTSTAAGSSTSNAKTISSQNGSAIGTGPRSGTGLGLDERTDTMDSMDTVGGNDIGITLPEVFIDVIEVDDYHLAPIERGDAFRFRRFSSDLGHRA